MESKILIQILSLMLLACASCAATGVIAPWTPPSQKGHSISCWGRTYRFDDSLLPSAIMTQRENVLAGPIEVVATVGGKRVQWDTTTFKATGKDAEAIHFTTSASSGSIAVECAFVTEFDGVTRADLEVRPKNAMTLDSLDIIIPLKTSCAKLFHHSSLYPVHVWDWPTKQMNAGAVKAGGLKLPFVFHLWLGNDDRGLQIFSESDEAWSPSDAESAVTITPNGDVTTIKMNLLSNYKLSREWKWSFGFVATPVKPFAKDYLSLHYCQMGGYGIEKPKAPGETPLLDVYKDVGVNCLGFHESWTDEMSLPRPKHPEELHSLVRACHDRGIRLITYTGCYMSTRSPEYHKDWDMLPIGDHYQYTRPDNGDICRITCNNTGYPDVLISTYEAAFKKYGTDGVYMDGLSCPLPCTNMKHGCGYMGKDGQVHPTMPIWRTRDVMKRFYRLVKGRSARGVIVSHMSSSMLLPALSFADTYLDGEHLLSYMKIGAADYPEDVLRAEMCGHHFGIPGTQLPIRGDGAERERARTLCLLYDIPMTWTPEYQADIWRAWDSFGVTGAAWVPFWKSSALVTCGDKNVRISAYLQKGRGALLVVANLGAEPVDAALAIKLAGMGLKADTKLRAHDEAVGGSKLPMKNGRLTVAIKPGTFRLMSVQTELHK